MRRKVAEEVGAEPWSGHGKAAFETAPQWKPSPKPEWNQPARLAMTRFHPGPPGLHRGSYSQAWHWA